MAELLKGVSISKNFGGLPALEGVDFQINRGEILGFIGPNGAGKTTLINVVTGLIPSSGGQVWFMGKRIDGRKPHQIGRMGIARTFQIVRPFHGMTYLENVMVGAYFGRRGHAKGKGEALRQAREILEMVCLADRMDSPARDSTIPDLKRLELAKALAMEPELLLLDEVMAGLNPKEVGDMMGLLRGINAEGMTMLVVEHVMKAIMGLSDRVIVLHHGRKIAEGSPAEISEDDAVIKAYLGQRYMRMRAGRDDPKEGGDSGDGMS